MHNHHGKHTCDELVRCNITQHKSCGGGDRIGSTRTGQFLNLYSPVKLFEDEKDYEVCYLNFYFNNNRIKKPPPPPPPPRLNTLPIVSPPPLSQPKSRNERAINNDLKKSFRSLMKQ